MTLVFIMWCSLESLKIISSSLFFHKKKKNPLVCLFVCFIWERLRFGAFSALNPIKMVTYVQK